MRSLAKILIVGNGGREHALLWKLKQDAPEAEFFITGGNGGTAALATALPFAATDVQALGGWVEANGVDLTVVGPEAPLAEGLVDYFTARGLAAFGPTRAAAEIESSKAFAKSLMQRHGIPTAAFRTFDALPEAEDYVRDCAVPVVIKASGLAAGKGVVIAQTRQEALDAVREMLEGGTFGSAGRSVVVEEFMEGEELSVFALTDGENVLAMLPAQDHKRIGEGDTGPNTGGMGAYAPVAIATPPLMARITDEVLLPTLAAMRAEERPFRGLLYAGLMITPAGPKVVEFNCRFGDPETQVILPLLDSSLLDPIYAIASGGSIEGMALRWKAAAAVATVIAAKGYPGPYETGTAMQIDVPKDEGDTIIFHAGTALRNGQLVTSGGRVAAATALGRTVAEAAERSRNAAAQIRFGGAYSRGDIGWREFARGASAGA